MEWAAGLMGGTSRRRCAATLPPDRFYCLLDDLPLHLIPRSFSQSRQQQELLQQPMFLSPNCMLFSSGQLPDQLSGKPELVARFALQQTIPRQTIVWVRDPVTEALIPFWLGPTLELAVRELRPGVPAPQTLSPGTLWLLLAAGIVAPETDADQHGREGSECVESAAPVFQKKDYVPVGNLIHPFHVAALRRYYRFMIRQGMIHLGDDQSPRRYVAHNEPVARFFHHQIAATVSALAGQPVKPSYVYLASYLSGAELKKHTDREQCEFSVTLCLDFSPEPERETPWPIHLDTPLGKVTVHQSIGDGLVYRGTRLPHYRDVLPAGQTSTSIFFHYVAADFKGSLT